jgi:hypothetical protein
LLWRVLDVQVRCEAKWQIWWDRDADRETDCQEQIDQMEAPKNLQRGTSGKGVEEEWCCWDMWVD